MSQVLKKYENTFFDVVNAKLNLLKLKRKKVITESLLSQIESVDNEDAKELLFDHLTCHADVAALREYCKVIIAAGAFPKMQQLGERMLSELPPEGVLEWCVVLMCTWHVCMYSVPEHASVFTVCKIIHAPSNVTRSFFSKH